MILQTPELKATLKRAVSYATTRQHEYATVEHLLFALLEDKDASAVLIACGVVMENLRGKVKKYLDTELSDLNLFYKEDIGTRLSRAFQNVIKRAEVDMASAGREEVTGENVLVALLSERESSAVYFLREQNFTRYDAINYIAHGISRAASQAQKTELSAEEANSKSIKPSAKRAAQGLTPRQLMRLRQGAASKRPSSPRERLMYGRYDRALKGIGLEK